MENKEIKRPGGASAKRDSHVKFICDTSGSMAEDGKIAELNNCLRESIPHILKLEEENPAANIIISVMQFDTKAAWVHKNVAAKDFVWKDLKANPDGETNLGEAFNLLTMDMKSPEMPERGYPPLNVVISDGNATDSYKPQLDELLKTNWGAKSIRHAIAIGKDADMSALNKFINNNEIKVLKANSPEQLAKAIRFVSTVALKNASIPKEGLISTPEAEGKTSSASESGTDDVW